ncbi:GyrI-like domain-containing protein [Aureibaculum conchae]|uniref:GyrI-like domain-containing protein n=1 Tax=Aureibaculum sp. 2308TA14-22 TaxID=3108392 RepID=UPI0033954F26
MQQSKIINIEDRKLVGLSIQTCLAENKTRELWQTFRPLVKEVSNTVNTDFYSLQVYDNDFGIKPFTPQTEFEKWAAVEVSNFDNIPKNLKSFILAGGDYAVFIHKGTPQQFHKTASYIYGEWLPKSNYQLDNRPHFEIIPENNKLDDPSAEEEVWIPIKLK